MDTFWFIMVAVVLFGGSIAVGVIRNRRFSQKERLHAQLSTSLSLDLAYASPEDYSLFGEYREYPLRIEPINLATPGSKSPAWHTRLSIPVQNPLRKMIRIARREEEFSSQEKVIAVARPNTVHHDLDASLDIQTNDLMFAGIVLSENVKISVHTAFRNLSAGVMGIEDLELLFVFPGLLTNEDQIRQAMVAADLLCDIKDELA